MNVRLATLLDLGALAEVHVASWQEAYVGQVPQDYLDALSVDERRRTWVRTYESEAEAQAAIFVLTDGDATIGFAHVCPSRDSDASPAIGEVTSIYLRRAYWGRGGGRALMAAALGALRARGFDEATLWVLAANERARGFYEVTGWKHDGEQKVEHIGNAEITEVRYRRSLD